MAVAGEPSSQPTGTGLVVPFVGRIDQQATQISAVAGTTASIVTSFGSIIAGINNLGSWAWWMLAASLGVLVLLFFVYYLPRVRRRRALDAIVAPVDAPVAVRTIDFPLTPWSEDSAATFERPDKADIRVIDRIVTTEEPLLYLEGRSGVGKSSLLFASVVPKLKNHPKGSWTIVVVRPFDDPLEALQKALLKELGLTESADDERKLVETLAAQSVASGKRLLIVLDQFEEALILPDEADLAKFSSLMEGLCKRPVKGLLLLISIRSDYTAEVERLPIILPNAATNWLVVKPFTHLHARAYLNRQNPGLSEETIDRILREAAEIENDVQYVRPIVINMFGLVVSSFAGNMPREFVRSRILRHYVQNSIRRTGTESATRDVLRSLLTSAGTKHPRTLNEIASDARIDGGAVRGILNQLSDFGLVRPLDDQGQKWEVSHDFVAQLISNLLEPPKPTFWTRARKWSAPIAVGLWLVLITSAFVAWGPVYQVWARSELARLGFMEVGEATSYAYLGDGTLDRLSRGMYLLGQLDPPVKKVPVRQQQVITSLDNFPPLSPSLAQSIEVFDASAAFQLSSLNGMPRLPELRTLILNNSSLENLKGMPAELPKLERLTLASNRSLTTLEGLPSSLPRLAEVDLSNNPLLVSLEGFRSGPALARLTLDADLPTLRGYPADGTALRRLDLGYGGFVGRGPESGSGLSTLAGLPSSLPDLEVIVGQDMFDFEGFRDFPEVPNLKLLGILGSRQLENFIGLPEVSNLVALVVADTSLSSLAGFPSDLSNLLNLNLSDNATLRSLVGLPDLPTLRYLDLSGTGVTSLVGLPKSMPSLQHFSLAEAQAIVSWDGLPDAPLRRLDLSSLALQTPLDLGLLLKYAATLEQLDIGSTPMTGMEKLQQLTRLRILDLSRAPYEAQAFVGELKQLQMLNLRGHTRFDEAVLKELLPSAGGLLECLLVDDGAGLSQELAALIECPSPPEMISESNFFGLIPEDPITNPAAATR